jgi:glycosyltransferase involved in cell wall biosynthesis
MRATRKAKELPHLVRQINVLWVMKELAVGGAERLLLEIAPALRGAVEFHPVAAFDEPRIYEDAYVAAGFGVRTMGARHPFDLRWMSRIRTLAADVSADLVHLHLPYIGALGRLALASKGRPIVYTEHSLWSNYRPLTRQANALTFGMNQAVIAVSAAVQESILESPSGRRLGDRLRVIHNGISVAETEREAIAQSQLWAAPVVRHPAYGTIGHLRLSKGVDVLLRASLLVREELPTATGYVVGSGEDAARLDGERRALNAPVQFLGTRNDARGLADAFDVVVFPSRVEGMAVALLEAMALGKPIVASRAGGIPEMLDDGESGLLVDVGDEVGLASAIVTLLRDPDFGRRLGVRAREVVRERFSARTMAENYFDVYRAVLREKRL